ncbi:sigma-70 family RNA polymerase sigma factor [Flavobacteriaceae bacterium MHTCC 0001]
MNLENRFEEIYKTNYPKVKRLCMGYTNGDDTLSNDITQEIFIKVWENLGSFRNESNISTWIYRIAVNTCLLNLRKKKTFKISKEIQDIESEAQSPDYDKENKLKKLYNCINLLKKDSKSIILLELEGLPQKEIAEIMGMSHEAVRVRIHRIKNELTKCIKHGNI